MAVPWDKHDSERGDFAYSRELQEETLESHRHLLGEKHPDTLTAMTNALASFVPCQSVKYRRIVSIPSHANNPSAVRQGR